MEKLTLVVLSGGTIDAEPYRETPVNVTPLKNSIIPETIKELGMEDDCVVYQWLSKDSKDFTHAELIELATLIRREGYASVVVVHGTDHMVENSGFLQSQQQILGPDVAVVFTGAMIPIMNEVAGYERSDGPENLRFAIEQAISLPSGVHIAFAGEIFDPSHTVKDFANKRFLHTDTPSRGR